MGAGVVAAAGLVERPQGDWLETPAGLLVPATARPTRRWPTCVDLFCGCGGFSLGMMQAGFEVVAALDHDPTCALTYTVNLGRYPCQFHFVEDTDRAAFTDTVEREYERGRNEAQRQGHIFTPPVAGCYRSPDLEPPGCGHFFLGDIRKVRGADILAAVGLEVGELDCVVGGPPCQGFSKSNARRNCMDPRNSLVFEWARLVLEMRPKTMVMENVPDIVSMTTPEGVPVVDALCKVLEDGGFGEWDALRRSLMGSAGMGAAIRGASRPRAGQEPAEQEQEPVQLGLFGEVTV